MNSYLQKCKKTVTFLQITAANLLECCRVACSMELKLNLFWNIYQKRTQQLEPVEQQHPNTITLSQVHCLSVSKKKKKIRESGERLITDRCEKQIKMLVSNYWPSALFYQAGITLETAACCEKAFKAIYTLKSLKYPSHLSLLAKWKEFSYICITSAILLPVKTIFLAPQK